MTKTKLSSIIPAASLTTQLFCIIVFVAALTLLSGCPQRDTPQSGLTDSAATSTPLSAGAIQNLDQEYIRGVELVKSERFSEAADVLTAVVRREPRNAEAWRWLGDAQYNLIELRESIQSYSQALILDPGNYFALRNKGFAMLHLGHEYYNNGDRENAHDNYAMALQVIQEALRIMPKDYEAMYIRAMAAEGASRKLYANAVGFRLAGDNSKAQQSFRNCVQVIDEGLEAAKQRVQANAASGEVGPHLIAAGLYERRGELHMQFELRDTGLDDLRKALQRYQVVVDLLPSDPRTRSRAETGVRDVQTALRKYGA